ncbi:MAG: D-alanine--D-alanine ligase [Planctomycetota bacterium]
MKVGITYDLRDEYLQAGYTEEETAEFDRADTVDSIEGALRALGHEPDRIGNARQLVERVAQGDRWDLVFNICEGLRGMGREAQVPAILDLFEIPYTFADTSVMCACLDKSVTKCIVASAGLPTPGFALVEDEDQAIDLAARVRTGAHAGASVNSSVTSGLAARMRGAASGPLELPLFAKPVAEGTGKGITPASRVATADELESVVRRLLRQHQQPVLVEEFLPGREFTVGLVGTGREARCLGTLEIVLLEGAEPGVYSYVNKERCEELVEYRLVTATADAVVRRAEEVALAAWRALGCRDGGRIDLRCSAAGEPHFLEANPLAGLHPFHSDLPMLATAVGMSYVDLVRCIVESAAKRVAAPRRAPPSTTAPRQHPPGHVAQRR